MTAEEVARPIVLPSLCQSQSTLSVIYSFTGTDTNSGKAIPIYEAKVIKKKTKVAKKNRLKQTLTGLNNVPLNDNIITQEVSTLVKQSNCIFLECEGGQGKQTGACLIPIQQCQDQEMIWKRRRHHELQLQGLLD